MVVLDKQAQTQKFTVEFSADAINALDGLKEKLGKKSRADVLRVSLLLFKYLMEETEKGNQIALIQQGTGDEKEKVSRLALFV